MGSCSGRGRGSRAWLARSTSCASSHAPRRGRCVPRLEKSRAARRAGLVRACVAPRIRPKRRTRDRRPGQARGHFPISRTTGHLAGWSIRDGGPAPATNARIKQKPRSRGWCGDEGEAVVAKPSRQEESGAGARAQLMRASRPEAAVRLPASAARWTRLAQVARWFSARASGRSGRTPLGRRVRDHARAGWRQTAAP